MKKALRIIGVYFLAFLLPLGLDHLTELLGVRPYNRRDAWYHAIFKAGFWYQRLVTLTPRKPRVHFVRIVSLKGNKEPAEVLGHNTCGERGQRAFTARLVENLLVADPALIVVDKYYDPETCPLGDRGTQELREALVRVSHNIPIILGRAALTERDLEEESPEILADLKKRGFSSYDQLAKPSLQFENAQTDSEISYGFLTLDYELRKIPLRWPVYENKSEVGQKGYPAIFPTLAMVAAQRYDREAGRDLKRHPFTSYLSEDELRPYSAADVVCGPSTATVRDWKSCMPAEGNRIPLPDLRHRIVLIGEYDRLQDFHESPIGDLPGYMLQANYIEALLDDRYLKPVAPWIVFALSLTWFMAIEWVFDRKTLPTTTLLLYAISISALLGLTFYVVAVVNLGFYLNLWPTGLFAVFLRYLLALLVGRS